MFVKEFLTLVKKNEISKITMLDNEHNDFCVVFSSRTVVGIQQTAPIHVEFEIPTDAETLTISVSDAGDGIGCNHYIMGDARLRHMPQ